jgi:hypothetical protein
MVWPDSPAINPKLTTLATRTASASLTFPSNARYPRPAAEHSGDQRTGGNNGHQHYIINQKRAASKSAKKGYRVRTYARSSTHRPPRPALKRFLLYVSCH